MEHTKRINDILCIFGFIRKASLEVDYEMINPSLAFDSLKVQERLGRKLYPTHPIRKYLYEFIRQSNYFYFKNTKGRGLICKFKTEDIDLIPIAYKYEDFITKELYKIKSKNKKVKLPKWKVGDTCYTCNITKYEILAYRADKNQFYVKSGEVEFWISPEFLFQSSTMIHSYVDKRVAELNK